MQSKPIGIPSKQIFLVIFYYLFNKKTPFMNCPENRTEQNRTKLSLFPLANSEIVVPFPFKLTYNCSKTTGKVTFMQNFKYITNRYTDNGIQ